MSSTRDHGPQPLEQIMSSLALKNQDLVKHSAEQLTHKNVVNGRKGRRLSPNIQHKILNALNAAQVEKKYTLKELFNYECP